MAISMLCNRMPCCWISSRSRLISSIRVRAARCPMPALRSVMKFLLRAGLVGVAVRDDGREPIFHPLRVHAVDAVEADRLALAGGCAAGRHPHRVVGEDAPTAEAG